MTDEKKKRILSSEKKADNILKTDIEKTETTVSAYILLFQFSPYRRNKGTLILQFLYLSSRYFFQTL